MTKAKAKKLCVKKWEWILENWESAFKDERIMNTTVRQAIGELKDLRCGCAYCELYFDYDNCSHCPIVKKFGESEQCLNMDSTYLKIISEQTARAMLKLIKKT